MDMFDVENFNLSSAIVLYILDIGIKKNVETTKCYVSRGSGSRIFNLYTYVYSVSPLSQSQNWMILQIALDRCLTR